MKSDVNIVSRANPNMGLKMNNVVCVCVAVS